MREGAGAVPKSHFTRDRGEPTAAVRGRDEAVHAFNPTTAVWTFAKVTLIFHHALDRLAYGRMADRDQRGLYQVVAVQLDQIAGIQEHAAVIPAVSDTIERRFDDAGTRRSTPSLVVLISGDQSSGRGERHGGRDHIVAR